MSHLQASVLLPQTIEYINYHEISPGQVRFSSRNVQLKIDAAFKNGDVTVGPDGCFHFKYYNGQSIFPEKEALPVIKAPFGYVLADGHHHTLAAISLGAQYLPIRLLADYSDMSPEQFWCVAEKNNQVFLYDLEGNHLNPPLRFNENSLYELIDDANRYFAAITARKCEEGKGWVNSTGAEYPLWIKVGKDIPFIEFRIADALRNAGIVYSYEMGDEPSEQFVEQARQVLVQANIPGLRVVNTRTRYTEL